MRTEPIAAVLVEGGRWLPWRKRHAAAAIKIYANGKVKDRILGHNRRYARRQMQRLKRVIAF